MRDNTIVVPNNREYYWDNLKGFLIIMVVLGHSIGSYDLKFNIAHTIGVIIYTFHMPLFIFAGGYFSRKSSRLVGARAFKLLKIYLIMQLIYGIAEATILGGRKEFVFDFVYGKYTYWYLLSVAVFVGLTVFMKDVKMWTWIIISTIIAFLAGFDPNIGNAYSFSRILFFLPFFSLGYYINMERFLLFTKKCKYIFSILAIGILGLIFFLKRSINREVFMGRDSYIELFPNYPLYGLYYRTGAYLIIAIMSCTVLAWSFRRKSFLSIIGKYTLPIYLVHGILLNYLRIKLSPIRFSSNVKIDAIVTTGLYVFIIGLVSTAVILILKWRNEHLRQIHK